MTKKIKYEENPFGAKVKIGGPVKDFLPSPKELAKIKKTKKITLDVTEESINFFKKYSKNTTSSYKDLMSLLLERYTLYFKP